MAIIPGPRVLMRRLMVVDFIPPGFLKIRKIRVGFWRIYLRGDERDGVANRRP
jgi:hypothetical protein